MTGEILPGTDAIRPARHIALVLPPALAACTGRHSWLAGAGAEARAIEALFWPFLVGSVLIWTLVMAAAVAAYRLRPRPGLDALGRRLIFWGGAVVPTAVVVALLVVGLFTLRALDARVPGLTVQVDGEQWWWRVVYTGPGGEIETANEIRLPRGETAEMVLTSDDVIHSLWAPAIGGKMDMVPGRVNRLKLTPVMAGRWGGLCAEYCGGAHAQMRFEVVVMEPAAFRDWLLAEAAPAAPAALAQPGFGTFLDQGCGACHRLRGTEAAGRVGPDLTHLAARETFGAGIVPLTEANLARWIADPEALKPGVRMPGYPHLSGSERARLARFLMALK